MVGVGNRTAAALPRSSCRRPARTAEIRSGVQYGGKTTSDSGYNSTDEFRMDGGSY